MTKSEIIDRVSELVSDKSGEMRLLISSWINVVLSDIASRGLLSSLKQQDLITMTAGAREYTLATDTDQVSRVFVPAFGDPQGKLIKVSDDELIDVMFSDGFTAEGQPLYYNIFGRYTLKLHPIPDLTHAPVSPTSLQKLYVWGYQDAANLADNAEITEIKVKSIPTLVYGAYAMGAKFDSILDAQDATIKYERGVNRIVGDSNRDLDRPSQVAYREL